MQVGFMMYKAIGEQFILESTNLCLSSLNMLLQCLSISSRIVNEMYDAETKSIPRR